MFNKIKLSFSDFGRWDFQNKVKLFWWSQSSSRLSKILVSLLSPCLDLLHSNSLILPSTQHSPVHSRRMLSWSLRPLQPPSGSPGFRQAHPHPREPQPTLAGLLPPTRMAQEPAEHLHVQTQPESPTQVPDTDPVLPSDQRNFIRFSVCFSPSAASHSALSPVLQCDWSDQDLVPPPRWATAPGPEVLEQPHLLCHRHILQRQTGG